MDFIIAMTIVILGVGILFATAGIKNFEAKETLVQNELNEKTETALVALMGGGQYNCVMNGNVLAYSLDLSKIGASSPPNIAKLKSYTALKDYNVSLEISGSSLFGEDLSNAKNIVGIDVNVLTCNSAVTFADLNKCLTGSMACVLPKQKATLRVGR